MEGREVKTDKEMQAHQEWEGAERGGLGQEALRLGVSREEMREIGGLAVGQVLTYNPENQVEDAQGQLDSAEAEIMTARAEVDNGYAGDVAEALNDEREGVSQVGEESDLLRRERLARDEENRRNEDDPKRDTEARIVARSQEELGKMAEKVVEERFSRKKSYAPWELVAFWKEMRGKAFEDLENPIRIGGDN